MADSSTEKKRVEEYGVRTIKGRWSEWSMDGNGLECDTEEQIVGLTMEDLAWLIEPHRDALFAPSDQALSYPDPTEADIADPAFEAIWQAVKDWDVSREPGTHRMYAGTTGNDVMHILSALRAAVASPAAEAGKAQAEWVAVSERLPEVHTTALVMCRSRTYPDRLEPGFRLARLDDDGDWIEAGSLEDVRRVVRWLAIPPPPSAPEGT